MFNYINSCNAHILNDLAQSKVPVSGLSKCGGHDFYPPGPTHFCIEKVQDLEMCF